MSRYISDLQIEDIMETTHKAAEFYDKQVCNKTFLIITDDYAIQQPITFTDYAFKHLTGILSELSAKEFYRRALKGTLSESDIEPMRIQKYSLFDFHERLTNILNMHTLLHTRPDNNLYLVVVQTSYYTYPCMLQNNNYKLAVGFKPYKHGNIASTMQRSKKRTYQNKHEILAVLECPLDTNIANKLHTVTDLEDVLRNCKDLKSHVTAELYDEMKELTGFDPEAVSQGENSLDEPGM